MHMTLPQKISISFALVVITGIAGIFGMLMWNMSQWSMVDNSVLATPAKPVDSTVPESIVYKDEKYGFSLELPASWQDYVVVESSEGRIKLLKVVLPTKEPGWYLANDPSDSFLSQHAVIVTLSLMPVDIFLKEQEGRCGEKPAVSCLQDFEIGRTNEYVIIARQEGDIPQDEDFQKKWFATGYSQEKPLRYVNFFKKGFKALAPASTSDWKIYRNEQYGFEVKYPAEYQVKQNKSGWPHSIALLSTSYSQSYELVIEIWENEVDLKAGMEERSTNMAQVTTKKLSDGRPVTFLNQNDDEDVARIIPTFKLIQ